MIYVDAVNSAPVLSPIGSRSVAAGQLLRFTVFATDPNNDTLTYSALNLPSGAGFNAATRIFSWTPSAGQVGTYTGITFQVSDGIRTDSESITLTVIGVNSAPVLNPIGNRTITAGQPIQFTITATDPNNDPLVFSASGLPSGAGFNPATRTFSWTPTLKQAGTYSNIAFQVSDSSLQDSRSITITVEEADVKAPVIGSLTGSEIEPDSIVIRWTTDEPSTSQVEYWASPRQLSPLDDKLVSSHQIRLTGLAAGTAYQYVTLSRDEAGNLTVSDEHTFTTPLAFTVSGLTVTPAEAQIGDTVTISALVTSNTDTAGTYELLVKIAGATVSTMNVDLAAGEQKKVSFTTTRYAAGSSIVDIHGAIGSLVVRPSMPKAPRGLPLGMFLGILPLAGVSAVAVWYYRRRYVRG